MTLRLLWLERYLYRINYNYVKRHHTTYCVLYAVDWQKNTRIVDKVIIYCYYGFGKKEETRMARSMTYRIKEMLCEKNISQKQLSEMTGITESAISHYIKGDRVPRGTNLIKIAKALGTTADDLLSGDKEMDKDSDLVFAKSLIARNASQMTKEERMEFIAMLMDKGEKDEA